jgi:cytochrome c oxidase accessory protein FixG
VLLAVLLAVPWIRVGGEPLLLLDIPARRFHVFGLVLLPDELYFLWLIIALLALALFFFTALGGRLWCGWACPQTVLTDLFAAAARRIQGYTRSGRPERVAPWRIALTHVVWVAFALVLGFHLVGYFRSPYQLLADVAGGSPAPVASGFWLAASVLAWLDLVVLKQDFCKYLCPYARFQSVLFDSDTLVIGYDRLRGEPRGKRGRAEGDCIDCGLCVAVCPTGIDIRDGLQLECIACTQCIDACNDVMHHVQRAPNLIGYRSLVGLERVRRMRFLRPRVAVYGALLGCTALAFATALVVRSPLAFEVEHYRSALSERLADGRLGNAYTLHVRNRARETREFRIRLDTPFAGELVAGVNPIALPAASVAEARVFVVADPRNLRAGVQQQPFRFVLEDTADPSRSTSRATTFVVLGAGGRP